MPAAEPKRAPDPASPGAWFRFAPLLLVAAVALAYANSLRVPLLLDDRSAIEENASITDLGRLGSVLAPAGTTTAGRPLLNLSYALNHATGGRAVVGYHVVNVAIHALAALALFGLVRRTPRRPGAPAGVPTDTLAFLVALLWSVHPLLTNAVTYLSQRAESLMGLWYLLTLYAFARAATSARPSRWLTVSVVACAAGMLTKEVMITAPVVVLLYDRVFFASGFRSALARRPWYYAGLVACWVLLGWLMVSTGLGERDVGFRAGDDWVHYAFTQCRVLVQYVRLALVPYPLVFDYGQEILVRRFIDAAAWLPLVLAALAAAGWAFRRGAAAAGFLGATFFILLSPTSSFVPVMGQPMAESRMYLPLVPLVVLAVIFLGRLLDCRTLPVLVVLAVVLAGATVRRNADYQSALGLWEQTVARTPGSSRGHYNLANELVQAGRPSEAIAHYEAALAVKPDLVPAHNNLANELAKIPGREDEALAHYEAALQLDPGLAEAHENAARLLRQRPGRRGEALGHLEAVVRLRPDSVTATFELANELAQTPGRAEESIPLYEQVLRLRPDHAEAHNNLANRLARVPGRLPEALEHYEAALRLRPDFLEAHYNYANKLASLPGRLPDAISHYEAVLRLNPRLPEAHKNLALALANLGQLDAAAAHLETALQLRPGYPEARALLDQVRAAQGR